MESELIPLLVILPLAAAIVANLLHGRSRALRFFTFVFLAAMLYLPLMTSFGVHVFGGHISERYGIGLATGIEYVYSHHQRIMIFALFMVVFLAIVSYAQAYERISGPYICFFMLGIAATSAIVMADDFFNLYVFMEIALLSQTALAISSGTLESKKASLKYLMVANVAGNCMLLGVALLLSITGSVNLTDIKEYIASSGPELMANPVFLSAASFIVFAWLYASGLFPFHNIKSELYAAAKPHASAIMQTQTKIVLVALGLIVLRLFSGMPAIRHLMLFAACLAMVFGVIMALKQDNYQRMLSYHAISQAGYVAAGIAIGTPLAIVAAIFHALNNAIYKSALFLGCEALRTRYGTSDFKSLGAAMHSAPFLGLLVLVAKLAISGVPPFNGFQSKLMLMVAAFESGMWEVTAIMILVSVLTFISMMKAFHLAYMRPKPDGAVEGAKPIHAYIPALIVLVVLCVVLGIFPELATDQIWGIAVRLGGVWR